MLAGLAMLRVLQAAFVTAFSSRFTLGALVTFIVTVADITILNIGAAFWGLVAGIVVSLLLERPDFAGRAGMTPARVSHVARPAPSEADRVSPDLRLLGVRPVRSHDGGREARACPCTVTSADRPTAAPRCGYAGPARARGGRGRRRTRAAGGGIREQLDGRSVGHQ